MRVILSILTAVLAAVLLFPLSGCHAEKQSKKVIGLSVLTLVHDFFKDIGNALTEEGARHGYEVIQVSGDFDVAKQSKQIQDFIVKRVDVIVLSPCNSKAIGPVIQEANAAGVPVFTVDIACLAPGAKVVSHIATDNLEGGRQAAQALIKVLGAAGGKVAILDHKPAESCLLRVQGFKEVIAKHNENATVGKIEIV
jgi:ribose transport system substrate-binding protein